MGVVESPLRMILEWGGRGLGLNPPNFPFSSLEGALGFVLPEELMSKSCSYRIRGELVLDRVPIIPRNPVVVTSCEATGGRLLLGNHDN